MDIIKISIIIPVYNVEKYLRKCLDSVINQTLKDIEIICVDDGSTDNSLEILREYASKDSRIIIINQENSGAGIARNNGMAHASGKYLYFMDSDDWLEDDALIKMYNKAEAEQADIVLFGSYNAVNGQQIKRTWSINLASEPYRNKMELCSRINSSIWDKLYLSSFIKNHHILFEGRKSCNDVFFSYYSIILADRICVLEDYLYNYRQNADGAISRTRGEFAFCLPQAMQHIKEKLKERKIWKDNKSDFYKKYFLHLHYEYQKCTKYSQKMKLVLAMDKEDLFVFFLNKIMQNIFYIGKTYRHIIIKILGIKISYRRGYND